MMYCAIILLIVFRSIYFLGAMTSFFFPCRFSRPSILSMLFFRSSSFCWSSWIRVLWRSSFRSFFWRCLPRTLPRLPLPPPSPSLPKSAASESSIPAASTSWSRCAPWMRPACSRFFSSWRSLPSLCPPVSSSCVSLTRSFHRRSSARFSFRRSSGVGRGAGLLFLLLLLLLLLRRTTDSTG